MLGLNLAGRWRIDSTPPNTIFPLRPSVFRRETSPSATIRVLWPGSRYGRSV